MWMCAHGYVLNCGVKDSDGSYQPSRWQGRCVDYAVSTKAGLLSAPSFWAEIFRSLRGELEPWIRGGVKFLHGSNPLIYLKPGGISSEVWRTALARRWQCADAILAATIEEEQYSFKVAGRLRVRL